MTTTVSPSSTGTATLPANPAGARGPDMAPATAAQQRAGMRQRGPTDQAIVFRLAERVATAQLQAALDTLLSRHDLLRAAFQWDGATLLQCIPGRESIDVAVESSRARDDGDDGDDGTESVMVALSRPIELDHAPLLRLGQVDLPDGAALLWLQGHEIIADERSLLVAIRELSHLLRGDVLPDPCASYMLRRAPDGGLTSGSDAEQHAAYWQRRFSIEPPVLSLALRDALPETWDGAASEYEFALPEHVRLGLGSLAVVAGVERSTVLLALYFNLLRVWGRQTDIVVAASVDLRTDGDTIGPLSDCLPIRQLVAPQTGFLDFVAQLAETLSEARAHEDGCDPGLLDRLRTSGGAQRPAYASAGFELRPAWNAEATFAGRPAYRVRLPVRHTDRELTLIVRDDGNQVALTAVFAHSLISADTVSTFCRGLVRAGEHVCQNFNQRLADIETMSELDRERVARWSAASSPAPSCGSDVGTAFVACARANPQAPCLRDAHTTLSFALCERYSAALAARLVAQLPDSSAVVAIAMGRSVESVVAMLGVLRAGRAYLPLDIHAPAARVAEILADSGATLVLTTERDRALLQGSSDFTHSPLDASAAAPASSAAMAQPARWWDLTLSELSTADLPVPDPILPTVSADKPAYVIYTSGSTGKPKGVVVPHRAIVALVESLEQTVYARLGERLRVAVVAPWVFDPSVQQIFASLLLGHELVLTPDEARNDGQRLIDFLRAQRIDVCDGTPAHLQLMASARRQSSRLTVRHFIIGGDVLEPAVVRALRERVAGPSTAITNVYGLTESGVDSTAYRLPAQSSEPSQRYPIGRPLPHAAVYVLDDERRLLPPGAIGELYIAGSGLALGYHERPGLTLERFLGAPWASDVRLLRTGDLGRWNHEGQLEFCGRVDNQVKLRGYRVELGEIEHVLLQYSAEASHGRTPPRDQSPSRCRRCVLTEASPGVRLDAEGTCSVCHQYDSYREHIDRYWADPSELRKLVEQARATRRGDHDCLLLFSGGKDSTYVLHRLVALGLRVHTFTFDNGFISKHAFENIERIVARLGVTHVTMRARDMNAVFHESLQVDSTVCSGCFRALTNISTRLAVEKGCPLVVTGLSRGQILDTKLEGLLRLGITDPQAMDRKLSLYRELYSSRKDRISQLLGVTVDPSEVPSSCRFVDYFRYDSATTHDILAYLRQQDDHWAKPQDTGFCSTNCLINDVGTAVHLRELGYHNYAAPLSWEVRIGVTTREQALQETSAPLDTPRVERMLRNLGYQPRRANAGIREVAVVVKRNDQDLLLCAYYTSDRVLDERELRAYLSARLPSYMVPTHFVHLERMPLNVRGKLDREALAQAPVFGKQTTHTSELPSTPMEHAIAQIWHEVLALERVGADADFFELGGESFKATVIAALVGERTGVDVDLHEIADRFTIREMAAQVVRRGGRLPNAEAPTAATSDRDTTGAADTASTV